MAQSNNVAGRGATGTNKRAVAGNEELLSQNDRVADCPSSKIDET
jgi:hypothetical protein